MAIGEAARRTAVQRDDADRLTVAEKWNRGNRGTTEVARSLGHPGIHGDILNVHDAPLQNRASSRGSLVGAPGKQSKERGDPFRLEAMMRPSVHQRAVEFPQTRARFAQLRGTSRDQVEYRLRVVR